VNSKPYCPIRITPCKRGTGKCGKCACGYGRVRDSVIICHSTVTLATSPSLIRKTMVEAALWACLGSTWLSSNRPMTAWEKGSKCYDSGSMLCRMETKILGGKHHACVQSRSIRTAPDNRLQARFLHQSLPTQLNFEQSKCTQQPSSSQPFTFLTTSRRKLN